MFHHLLFMFPYVPYVSRWKKSHFLIFPSFSHHFTIFPMVFPKLSPSPRGSPLVPSHWAATRCSGSGRHLHSGPPGGSRRKADAAPNNSPPWWSRDPLGIHILVNNWYTVDIWFIYVDKWSIIDGNTINPMIFTMITIIGLGNHLLPSGYD